MEKETAEGPQRSTRAGRLREAGRQLRELPLERPPTDLEWEQITGELPQDDLEKLKSLAQGHLERALEACAENDPDAVADEARNAVLLWPRDAAWARQTADALRKVWSGPQAADFASALAQRVGKKKASLPRKAIVAAVWLLIASAVGTAGVLFWPSLNLGSPVTKLQGPRALETQFDTQGVKTNITVAQSRLLLFPEATVAELSAWVTFPDHRVDLWEGAVSLLDSTGKRLTKRDVVFRASNQGPLQAGQGVAVFEQFDAWPWFDQVASFQVATTRILAKEANPANRKEVAVTGISALTSGYNLKVWLLDDVWSQRFASRVHTLGVEFENSGLKPFNELEFSLVWRDPQGRVLKTLSLRPVSSSRAPLVSGGRLGWTQESVFATEVFTWPAGGEPHPVLELVRWQ